MSNISSISSTSSWETIKEKALENQNLDADIRVSADAIQVNAPSTWQRVTVAIGYRKAPLYPSRDETLENLREQFGVDFSRKLQRLVKETGIKTDSEEYKTLVTHAMQSFDVITQKLATSIAAPTVSTSQAIQEAHKGALTSLARLREKFATPQLTPQFCKTGDGKWSVLQPAPHPENFVLSGGGVKGAGYVGWFKAAEQFGLLKNLKRIAGSSAGAITAAMIASGMSAEDFEKANARTSFWSILTGKSSDPIIKAATQVETKGWISYFSFSGTYAVDRINQEMVGSIKNYLRKFKTQTEFRKEIETILASKVQSKEIQAAEKDQLVQTLTELYPNITPPRPHWLFGSLFQKRKPTYMVTFRDLAALAKIDSRFKELTVTGYSKTKTQEKYFNAERTPHLAIAKAVRGSMALPGAFDPVIIDDEVIIDGAVGSNTPVEIFTGFPKEKTLVLQFENDGRFNQTVYNIRVKQKAGVVEGWIAKEEGAVVEGIEKAVTDNPNLGKDAQRDRQKLYEAGPNAMMVAEGNLETVSFTASPERIREAQRQAEIRAMEAFSMRQDQAVDHVFSSLKEAMGTMSVAELKNIIEFYDFKPPFYDPDYEKKAGRGEVLPLSTESRRSLSSMLSREDRDTIAQAAATELASRSQSELLLS